MSKPFSFHVLNIKLQMQNEATAQDYENLFLNAYNNKSKGKISSDKAGIIRQLVRVTGQPYFYGIFCSFVIANNKALDIENREIIDYSMQSGLYMNPKETEFVFYPDIHRVAIRTNSKITQSYLITMLTDILNNVAPSGASIDISIHQDEDAFKLITEAKCIMSLNIEITPCNGDISPDAIGFMDDEIKGMGAQKISMKLKPHEGGSLSVDKSKVLNGALGMAQTNGSVEAAIIDKNDERQKVKTLSHPKLFKLFENSIEDARESLYNTLKRMFR